MEWPSIMTAMVTPFAEDGSLSETAAAVLAEWLVTQGSEGLVVAGTTGESPTLSDSEREQLFAAVRHGAGSAAVWMGTGSNDTREAVRRARQAETWGADGLLVVTPYYNKPPQEGLFRHFAAIAEAVSVPIMIYNVPQRTGVSIEANTIARLARSFSNIRAVKEASGTIDGIQHVLTACPDLYVYSGDDALFYPALTVGAHGVVSVASHVVGPEMARMLAAYKGGRVAEARAEHFRLLPVMRDLFSWPNPIPVKWALNHLGLPAGPVRLPLVYPEDTVSLGRLMANIQAIRLSASDSTAS